MKSLPVVDFSLSAEIGKIRDQATSNVLEDVDHDRLFFTCAGFPAAIVFAGMSETTTDLAPTIACSPTVTPGPIKASAQIQTSGPIVIGGLVNGIAGSLQSCEPAHKCAPCETVARSQIDIAPSA
jgi:hypothetical protein